MNDGLKNHDLEGASLPTSTIAAETNGWSNASLNLKYSLTSAYVRLRRSINPSVCSDQPASICPACFLVMFDDTV